MEEIAELLTSEFVQRALIAGFIVALTAPIIGLFMVLNRLSLIGDTIAHTAFAGVAIGVFFNASPIWSALAISVAGALGITKIRQSARISGDAALAVIFSGGLAIGVFLISITRTFTLNLSSLLFGSILLVSWFDVWLVAGVGFATVCTIILLYKELVHVALDEDLARASGLPVNKMNYLLGIIIGVMVVATMRVVGILMVSALLIIPALSAMQIAKSFKQSIILSVTFALTSVITGISIALIIDSAPGGSIVLSAVCTFLAILEER